MKTKWMDPVVEETRERGRAYTQRLGGDIHLIFEDLRRHQIEHPELYAGPDAPGLGDSPASPEKE